NNEEEEHHDQISNMEKLILEHYKKVMRSNLLNRVFRKEKLRHLRSNSKVLRILAIVWNKKKKKNPKN
ncbi:hypothetical protein HAX54_025738, partial [Datura stramonium]|nr:hypothetical protein [Datura stramonium]